MINRKVEDKRVEWRSEKSLKMKYSMCCMELW